MKKIFLSLALFTGLSISAQTGVSIEKATETVNMKIVFNRLTIEKEPNGNISAIVTFSQYDENNNKIDNLTYYKKGVEFNEFWAGFTTGKFLYTEIKLKDSLGNIISIPNSVENDFINQ